MKYLSIITCLLLSSKLLFSQVNDVSYKIEFNTEKKLYDVYLIINKGQAIKSRDRIQFNAQISIVAPSNCSAVVAQSYMPLIDNIDLQGENPMKWEMTNYLSKIKKLSDKSIFSISPRLGRTAFYNELKQGDKVKLFSLDVQPIPQNINQVRLYSNTKDLPSTQLEGSNFDNGFTLGGVTQIYVEPKENIIFKKQEVEGFSSKIFPVPAVDQFNIEIDSKEEDAYNISLADASGRVIRKSTITKKWSGPAVYNQSANLSSGLYTLIIESKGKVQEHKLLISK
jgi:hypothetical protein